MTLVTRDPNTGLRRGPIRYPNTKPPTPYGCRWCGTPQLSHGRQWIPSVGMHTWHAPTRQQILARMKARRTARLNAPTPVFHATTRWTGMAGDPEDPGYELCGDCGTENCPQYERIQRRRVLAFTDLSARRGTGRWGGDVLTPF